MSPTPRASSDEGVPAPGPAAPAGHPDWEAVENSPEFRELLDSRNRFVFWGTAFFTAYFFAVLFLLGFAKDWMTEPIVGSITVALALGLSVVLVTFVMAFLYARKSRDWSQMSERAAAGARASATGAEREAEPTGRSGR